MSQVKDFIKAEIRNIIFRNVSDDESLLKTRAMDSITVVDLAVVLEDKFGVKIPFTEISEENFDSVNQIAEFLAAKGVNAN
jgi:acyl carrier protein